MKRLMIGLVFFFLATGLRAQQKKGAAAADAERKSAALSEEAISVINEIAARSPIPYYPSGKDDADKVAPGVLEPAGKDDGLSVVDPVDRGNRSR